MLRSRYLVIEACTTLYCARLFWRLRFKLTRFRFAAAFNPATGEASSARAFCGLHNAAAAEESDCAARDRPDKTEIRSDDFAVTIAAPVATPAVAVAIPAVAVAASASAVAASAVAVAAPAVAVAAPAVTAVSTSCATGTLFSALPAHYGERAKHSFRSGDGREARPHNWW